MSEYNIALRPNSAGALDDVVVTGVEMFRAEQMSKKVWWLCCYLKTGERITWHMMRHEGGLRMVTVERPENATYEPGSM